MHRQCHGSRREHNGKAIPFESFSKLSLSFHRTRDEEADADSDDHQAEGNKTIAARVGRVTKGEEFKPKQTKMRNEFQEEKGEGNE